MAHFQRIYFKHWTLFSGLLFISCFPRGLVLKEMVVTDRQKIFLDKSPNIFNIPGQLGHNIHKMSK